MKRLFFTLIQIGLITNIIIWGFNIYAQSKATSTISIIPVIIIWLFTECSDIILSDFLILRPIS